MRSFFSAAAWGPYHTAGSQAEPWAGIGRGGGVVTRRAAEENTGSVTWRWLWASTTSRRGRLEVLQNSALAGHKAHQTSCEPGSRKLAAVGSEQMRQHNEELGFYSESKAPVKPVGGTETLQACPRSFATAASWCFAGAAHVAGCMPAGWRGWTLLPSNPSQRPLSGCLPCGYALRSVVAFLFPERAENEDDGTYDWGELAVSYRWTGWVWEITSWRSRMQENYRSFRRNL